MSTETLCSGRRARALARVAASALVCAACVAWPARAPASKPAPRKGAQAGAPLVQVMVVGKRDTVLVPARAIRAAAGTVRVGGRSCAVAAGTPLAVLLALSRAGGPYFSLRDYGHCGAAPRNSVELFVTAIAGQRNSGRSGWVYKVGGAAGSTGAADPSGPAGDGRRLRAGAQVLWFYCETASSGCQRTLAIRPPTTSLAPGSQLQLTVGADDDEGTLAPVMGASVMIASRAAGTGSGGGTAVSMSAAGGRAVLTVPTAPGEYELTASLAGFVPSFPAEVRVR